jgi:hypothetical protein
MIAPDTLLDIFGVPIPYPYEDVNKLPVLIDQTDVQMHATRS